MDHNHGLAARAPHRLPARCWDIAVQCQCLSLLGYPCTSKCFRHKTPSHVCMYAFNIARLCARTRHIARLSLLRRLAGVETMLKPRCKVTSFRVCALAGQTFTTWRALAPTCSRRTVATVHAYTCLAMIPGQPASSNKKGCPPSKTRLDFIEFDGFVADE